MALTDRNKTRIRNMAGTISAVNLAKEMGISPWSVWRFAKSEGLSMKVRGEQHGNSKTSDEDRNLVLCLHDEGVSIAEIARKLELPYRRVQWIIRNP